MHSGPSEAVTYNDRSVLENFHAAELASFPAQQTGFSTII